MIGNGGVAHRIVSDRFVGDRFDSVGRAAQAGNPFFAQEMVHELTERGVLDR